jgi:copper(I)-binding protein
MECTNMIDLNPTRRFRRIALTVAVVLLAVSAGACGDDAGGTADGTSGTKLVISDAWARTSATMQTTGAAYMSITGGDQADRLVGALAPVTIAKTTEIHETVAADASSTTAMGSGMSGTSTTAMGSGMSGTSTTAMGSGMMTMRPVSGIDVAAKGRVDLKPGGYHIMLLDLVSPLTSGQKFSLTLTFEKAGIIEVPVEVRAS